MNGRRLPGKYIAGPALVVVACAIGAALFMVGSPTRARARQFDVRRVDALGAIARALDVYVTRHGKLPPDLDELTRQSGPSLETRDPETDHPYEYRVTGSRKYELCATFWGETQSERYTVSDFWSHRAGRQCYELEPRDVKRE